MTSVAPNDPTGPRTRARARAWRDWTPEGTGGRIFLALALLVYLYVLLRSAWICDDAYITFRTVSNFLAGHGLTWNTDERVQAYTHPLWMFLLSGVSHLTGNFYYSALFASMALSLAAVLIYAFGIARTMAQAILGVTVLAFSKAFVDYSTSGLENPLSYLLVAWFLLLYFRGEGQGARDEGTGNREQGTASYGGQGEEETRRRGETAWSTGRQAASGTRLLQLSLLASLIALNRMDLLLLIAPALLHAFWRTRVPPPSVVCLGMSSFGVQASACAVSLLSLPGAALFAAMPAATPGATGSLPASAPAATPSCRLPSPTRLSLPLRQVGVLSLGFAPFLAWEIFSIIYYGFPFPNTAYAKLNTGIPAGELIRQGWCYFENSMRLDPLTLPAIGCALLAALSRRGRHLAIAAGIALYGLYVLRIGGDFMSGRFLAVPLFAAMAIPGSLKLGEAARKIVLAGGLLVAFWLGLSGPHPPLLGDSRYDFEFKTSLDIEGVADERAYYYQSTGLLRDASPRDIPTNKLVSLAAEARQDPTHVVASPHSMGILGYYAGPSVHLVDSLALPDPLLARLPVPRQVRWRIGHFRRFTPDGYVEGLRSGRNELTDLRLRRFHDQLRLITKGPIFSAARWRAILDMNLGRCASLVDVDYYRHPPLRVHTGPFAGKEDRWNAVVDSLLPPAGAWVYFGETCHATQLEITLDRSRDCRILYPQGPAEPAEQLVPADPSGSPVQIVQVPAAVSRTGFDRLLILPAPGDNACYVARIRVLDPAP